MTTLFTKIINKEIPADIVYEDEICLAFRDINPQAPVHILLIPKKEIVSIATLTEEDNEILAHLLLKTAEIAKQEGLEEKGYRVVSNIGNDGGQSVFHLHFHILGGRKMTWPPG
jgi:histidine triad (HIT) family protein